MKEDRKHLASWEVWRLAGSLVAATRRQTVALVVLGLVLPQIVIGLWLDLGSAAVVQDLRAIFTANAGRPGSFTQLLLPSSPYLLSLVIGMLLIFLTFCASYLGLVQTAIDQLRGEAPRGVANVWFTGLKRAVPAATVLLIAGSMLATIGQILVAPALVLGVLSLVVPVIYMAEGRGALRSLWSGLTIKYAKGSAYSGWGIVFHLLSLGAAFYAAFAAASLLSESLLDLDMHLDLPRTLWTQTLAGTNFSAVYLGVTVLESLITMAIVAMMPSLTAALYFAVAAPRKVAEV